MRQSKYRNLFDSTASEGISATWYHSTFQLIASFEQQNGHTPRFTFNSLEIVFFKSAAIIQFSSASVFYLPNPLPGNAIFHRRCP
ncbi:hypothetical protein AN403_181 [Pseudomonas fluorescens]|uniref:Uncharacterized protein n=1 Tax=Pseudomonas fluorescens TaxID=294 RepID=A0A0P8WFE1_PSEFL|nr:hypothetical protein AN403_181 [Pseudomonas fluorescens]